MQTPVEALRSQISEKKLAELDITEPQSELSLYYLSPGDYNFPYQNSKSDIWGYFDDFLYRDIFAAEEYVRRSMHAKFTQDYITNQIIQNPHFNRKNHIIFMALAGQTADSRKAEEEKIALLQQENLAYHYLGLEEDPLRIIHNFQDTPKYIQDWLNDIGPAEGHVVQSIISSPQEFFNIAERYPEGKQTEILNLMIKNLGASVVGLLKCSKAMLSSRDRAFLAGTLQDANNLGVLEQVLGERESPISQSIIKNKVLNAIKDFDTLVNVACHLQLYKDAIFQLVSQDAVMASIHDLDGLIKTTDYLGLSVLQTAYLIHRLALGKNSFSQEDKQTFVSAIAKLEKLACPEKLEQLEPVNEEKAPEQPEQILADKSVADSTKKPKIDKLLEAASAKNLIDPESTFIRFNEDITLDFYIASLKRDIPALLDLAFTKNPKLFTTLFCAELRTCCADQELFFNASRVL